MEFIDSEGYFENHGLDVELQTSQGGAATLPAVMTGSLDIAIGNPVSVILARSKGLDVAMVTGFGSSYADGEDVVAVVAPEGSDIETAADLEGRKVGVNTLKGHPELTIREATDLAGGNGASIEMVEIGFPDMAGQLEAGNLEAAFVVQPFLGTLRANGMKVVSYPFQESAPGQMTLVSFTSGAFAEENAEVVERFKKAMAEGLDHVEKHPDGVRAALPKLLSMPDEVAADLPLEKASAELDEEILGRIEKMMVKHGLLSEASGLDGAVIK
ncbi:ABC transporter substrate-binding protein [Arthrobacter luteolus]|uniref:ABC transporter substrate-binding protein n=1 Tax=Arthrobacter luteolus TaxID=98672 RepID=UPI00385061E3